MGGCQNFLSLVCRALGVQARLAGSFAAPRLRFAEGTRGAGGEEAEKGGGGRKGIGDKKIGISRFSLIFRGSAFGRMVGKKSEISRFSLIFETLQENQGLASR